MTIYDGLDIPVCAFGYKTVSAVIRFRYKLVSAIGWFE